MKRITYGSDESAAFADRMMDFFRKESWRASLALGAEKGAMPEFEPNRELYEDLIYNEVGLSLGPAHAAQLRSDDRRADRNDLARRRDQFGLRAELLYAYVRRDTIGTRTYAHPLAAKALGIELDQHRSGIDRARGRVHRRASRRAARIFRRRASR